METAEQVMERLKNTPLVPSTRLNPESQVEVWAAHKIPPVDVTDGVVSVLRGTIDKIVIRATYKDDQGRRCSRYIAEVFIYGNDADAALALAAEISARHNVFPPVAEGR